MPVVFGAEGYRFFFYNNDHRPIHVQVGKGAVKRSSTWKRKSELQESHGLKLKELSKAQTLAERHQELIIAKWHEHLER